MTVFPYIQIILAVLLVVAVLLQQTDANAGGAFGASDGVSTWRTRRGFERFIFIATLILAVLFVISAVLALRA